MLFAQRLQIRVLRLVVLLDNKVKFCVRLMTFKLKVSIVDIAVFWKSRAADGTFID